MRYAPNIIALLIFCSGLWWLAGKSQQASGSLPSFLQYFGAFATPIKFYGRVLDQHGAPVAGATVRGSAGVSPGGDTIKTNTTTDASGNFTLRTMGMVLFVSVDKPGYYHIFPKRMPGLVSEKSFDYAAGLGNGVHNPDSSKPAVLHLYQPGTMDPLIRLKSTSRRLSRSGEAVEVVLDPGEGDKHRIALLCTTDDKVALDGRYSWRFEVRVIEGGLQPAGGIFEFEAPAEGYEEADIIDMKESLPRPQWASSVGRSYFVRFNDDTYARIKVKMMSGGDHFVRIEGHYNPKPGSRNLEADPSQR